MAIQYVGGRGAGRAGSTSSVNVAINSGLTGGIGAAAIAGDLVIVTVAVATQGRNPSCAVTSGGGWTNKTQQHTTATTYDISVQTSYKIMPSTPDTIVTIPSTGNIADGQGYTIHVYRGVDPTNPEDVAAAYAAATGTGRANPASILPVTAGAWIYVGAGQAAATGTTAWTAAYLSALLQFNGADTNDGRAGGGHLTWPGGTYDPAVFGGGSTTSTSSWGATTLALRPYTIPPVDGPIDEDQAAQTEALGGSLDFLGTTGEEQGAQTEAAAGTVETAFSGAVVEEQEPQTEAASGSLLFSGAVAETQPEQTEAAAAVLAFNGAVVESQPAQTEQATGSNGFGGEIAETQAKQTEQAAGALQFNAAIVEAQAKQTEQAGGLQTFAATIAEAQAKQTEAAAGALLFSGQAAEAQPVQQEAIAVLQTLSGAIVEEQAPQSEAIDAFQGVLILGPIAETQAGHQAEAATGDVGAAPVPVPAQGGRRGRLFEKFIMFPPPAIKGIVSETAAAQTEAAEGWVQQMVAGRITEIQLRPRERVLAIRDTRAKSDREIIRILQEVA